MKHVLQPFSSKVLNAVNRAIYIYFWFLTKTIIGHHTVFYGLILIFRWLQYIVFLKSVTVL